MIIQEILKKLFEKKFVTKTWIELNDLSRCQYSVNKHRFKTSMIRSYLCDYSDAYIVVKRRVTVTSINAVKIRNKKLTFRNSASFR